MERAALLLLPPSTIDYAYLIFQFDQNRSKRSNRRMNRICIVKYSKQKASLKNLHTQRLIIFKLPLGLYSV